ncbi:hypothetical protein AVEN_90403-1 [Araneus ventricosus]|uniref:Uncharacterized protein n=1 Tax=Araneus ventricosus TaxID=182803 RepID=A0A4Y2GH24_ARAVE|nr:hypothetical protein AVEN_90403-1 [Araneus ventricosus]
MLHVLMFYFLKHLSRINYGTNFLLAYDFSLFAFLPISCLLVIVTSCFGTTRGLLWDRPRNFEPLSGDEDDTRAGVLLSKLLHRTSRRTLDPP